MPIIDELEETLKLHLHYGKTARMRWLDASHSRFHQQPMEKNSLQGQEGKVEFSMYGDTILHNI